jgi:hypothetical protein
MPRVDVGPGEVEQRLRDLPFRPRLGLSVHRGAAGGEDEDGGGYDRDA